MNSLILSMSQNTSCLGWNSFGLNCTRLNCTWSLMCWVLLKQYFYLLPYWNILQCPLLLISVSSFLVWNWLPKNTWNTQSAALSLVSASRWQTSFRLTWGSRSQEDKFLTYTNVAADRCQPSLMFITEPVSLSAADVIRSLLLLITNVWARRAQVSEQVQV